MHHGGASTPTARATRASLGRVNPSGHGHDDGLDRRHADALNFDLMFIDTMIPHHEAAIAMAQAALTRGEHPEIRDLAQEIIPARN